MLLPVSAEHGPAKMDGDFWRCFSHTPSGAVFAGLTLLLDISGALMLRLNHHNGMSYLNSGCLWNKLLNTQ